MLKPPMTEIRRDEKGRVIAPDGYPLAGLATANEGMAVSSLSRAEFHKPMRDGRIPSRMYGRIRRIQWAMLRRLLLESNAEELVG
ncbi:MAG: hypothetical protein ABGZ35_00005 [Planctomycetaceae bacterium]|jgi:hypothetical protein